MLFLCPKVGLLAWILLLSSKVQGNCPAPNLPPHSRLRGGGALDPTYPVGTVLRFQCIPGYEHIAGIVPSMTCLATLAWTSEPTFCRGKRCPVPNLQYSHIVSTSDLRLGEEVTFVCEHGFRMRGHATLRCILKGNTVEWNYDIPLCERIPCARPAKIPNGHYNAHPLDSYEFGEAVTYRCDPGLTLIGKDTIACIATPDGLNGMWNYPPPECKRVSCPQPSIQNGRFSQALAFVYKYDEKVSFTCDPLYNAVGNGLTTCGSDNNWHPSPPFCIREKKCPAPRIENGKAHADDGFWIGDVVTFSCLDGFRMVGPAAIQCILRDGILMWNGEFPLCQRISCAQPGEILNGSFTEDPHDEYYYGSVVTYHCDPGFSLIGNSAIECIIAEDKVNGKWDSPPPECKKIQCEQPKVQNGALINLPRPSYTYNEAVSFQCDPGYSLVGRMRIRCGANNSWVPAIPQCVKDMVTEDRLKSIEKKLDLILHELKVYCNATSTSEN